MIYSVDCRSKIPLRHFLQHICVFYRYYAVVAKVNAMEKKIEQLMDVELAEKTGEL